METEVIMERPLFGGVVRQKSRTSDGYFNANELIRQWNISYGKKKTVKEYLSLKDTKSFCDTISLRESPNRGNSESENQIVKFYEIKWKNTIKK